MDVNVILDIKVNFVICKWDVKITAQILIKEYVKMMENVNAKMVMKEMLVKNYNVLLTVMDKDFVIMEHANAIKDLEEHTVIRLYVMIIVL